MSIPPGRTSDSGDPQVAPPALPPDSRQRLRQDVLTLLFLGACAILIGLSRGLWDPDESRYAEIPREMLVHQAWLLPSLDGFTYLEKPPLNYWPTILLYRLFGVHAALARLVPGLYFLGTVLLMYHFVRRYLGREIAYFAAGVLIFQPLFLFLNIFLLTDGPLTFWLTLALTSLGRLRLDATPRARDAGLFWLGCLGAFFTKALIGLAFPLGILLVDGLLRRGAPRFRSVLAPWLVGGVVTLGCAGLWLYAMNAVRPGFYHYFFITQHLDRFLGAQHGGNWFLGLFAFLLFSWPWWPLLWPTLKTGLRALFPARGEAAADPPAAGSDVPAGWRPVQAYLLIWTGTIYGLFALSRGQLLPYYLPAMPALLVLLAIQFHLAPAAQQTACVRLGWLSGWLALAGGIALILSTGANFALKLEMDTGPLRSLVPGLLLTMATVLFYLIFGYRFLPRQPGRDPLLPYAGLMMVALFSLQVISPNQSSVAVAQDPLVRRLEVEHPDFQIVHWSDHAEDADRAAGLYFGFQREIVHVGSGLFPQGNQRPAELVYCLDQTDRAVTQRLLYPDWPAYLAANRPASSAPHAPAGPTAVQVLATRHVLLLVPRDRERDLPKQLPLAEQPVIHGRYILYHLALTPHP